MQNVERYAEGMSVAAAAMIGMRDPGTPPNAFGMWLQRNPGKRAKAKRLRKRLRAGRR